MNTTIERGAPDIQEAKNAALLQELGTINKNLRVAQRALARLSEEASTGENEAQTDDDLKFREEITSAMAEYEKRLPESGLIETAQFAEEDTELDLIKSLGELAHTIGQLKFIKESELRRHDIEHDQKESAASNKPDDPIVPGIKNLLHAAAIEFSHQTISRLAVIDKLRMKNAQVEHRQLELVTEYISRYEELNRNLEAIRARIVFERAEFEKAVARFNLDHKNKIRPIDKEGFDKEIAPIIAAVTDKSPEEMRTEPELHKLVYYIDTIQKIQAVIDRKTGYARDLGMPWKQKKRGQSRGDGRIEMVALPGGQITDEELATALDRLDF